MILNPISISYDPHVKENLKDLVIRMYYQRSYSAKNSMAIIGRVGG